MIKKTITIIILIILSSTIIISMIYNNKNENKTTISNDESIEQNNTNKEETPPEKELYKEEILNGAYPELDEKMIAVYYDGQNWKKADLYSEWYSYQKLNWANVVIVKNDKFEEYRKKEINSIININDIAGFFVWIPRYEYKLFNVNNELVPEQMIEINFTSKNTPRKTEIKNGLLYTHPAFSVNDGINNYELNGIWIAKFEPSLNENNVNILPNKHPIVSINMAKMWEYATSISSSYQLSISSRNITNIEWGAVAYLTNSQYGKRNNENYQETEKQVFNNNSLGHGETFDNMITGCSSGSTSKAATTNCSYEYNIPYYGYGASSTGTIYGVYDLSGGAWDCVMGIVSNYPIKNNLGGYEGQLPNNKRYYSFIITGANMYDRSRGLIGDATREVLSNTYKYPNGYAKSWNEDYAYLANNSWPWVKRGGAAGCNHFAGIFAYGITDAISRNDKTFRVVLSEY